MAVKIQTTQGAIEIENEVIATIVGAQLLTTMVLLVWPAKTHYAMVLTKF